MTHTSFGTEICRLRVLTVVDHYLPGFKAGGPIRSIENLVACLGDRIQFDIVTADSDFADQRPYPNVRADCWHPLEQARIRYLSAEQRSMAGWRSLLSRGTWDLIYLNSVFSRTAIRILTLRRLGLIPPTPVLVAPRGELHPGALSVHNRRKVGWLAFARRARLYAGLEWHASNEAEQDHIWRVFSAGAPQVHIARQVPLKHVGPASHGPAAAPGDTPAPVSRLKSPGTARVVFISRISPKKNLDYALRVLPGAAPDLEFDIYGPIEAESYWRACRALISPSLKVRYCGALPQHDVVPTFARYHLFLFPTRGESFGHVVLESLVAGCPVLVSDQTPWRELAARSAGWDLGLEEPQLFRARIRAVAEMDQRSFDGWSIGARALGRAWASDDTGVEAHRRMFFAVASGASTAGGPPASGDTGS